VHSTDDVCYLGGNNRRGDAPCTAADYSAACSSEDFSGVPLTTEGGDPIAFYLYGESPTAGGYPYFWYDYLGLQYRTLTANRAGLDFNKFFVTLSDPGPDVPDPNHQHQQGELSNPLYCDAAPPASARPPRCGRSPGRRRRRAG
jgi:hypothetical protein